MPNKNTSRAELLQELAAVRSQLADRGRQCEELSGQLDRLRLEDRGSCLYRLFDAMMEGFCLAELIFDKEGRPYDLRLTEINKATGLLLGIAPDKIKGITARQLFPKIDSTWIEMLVAAALSGEPAKFKKYSEVLDKWFVVYAFSPQTGLLAILFLDITESKQAEEELKHSRLLLTVAERLSHTGAWEWDIVDDRWEFSSEWLAIHGCPKRPLTPEELLALAHPEDRAAITQALEDLRQGIARYDMIHRIVRMNDGKIRFVHGYGRFVRDASGKVIKAYGFGRDITEQKLAEIATDRQNALLRGVNRIFEAVVTSAGDQEFGNACLNVAEEVTGSTLSFLGEIGPDGGLHDIAISNPTWKACPVNGKEGSDRFPKNFHIRGIYSDVVGKGTVLLTNDPASHPRSVGLPPGHPPLYSLLGVPLKQGERTVGLIAVGNRDGGYGPEDQETLEVLARVISEALARRHAEEAMRVGEIRYRSLFMHSPDAIYINQQDRITLVNDACLRLFGAETAEELLGKTPYDLFHADYHPVIRRRIHRMRELGQPQSLYEAKIVRLDGGTVDVEVTAAHFPFADSNAIHVILRDITSRKRAAENLERSNKELEQFAYAVSHDLQEPLRSVVGFLQLLQLRYSDRIDEKGQQFIDRAVAASHRMQTLIRELLSLSRVTTRPGTFLPTDLRYLVETVLENLESTLREKHAHVVVCADLPSLTVDPSLIESLFQNLIINGIKYNDSFRPRIEINCRPCENGYEFTVKDNGIGVPPRFHERIFMVFQRLHTTEEYQGTGLGLALCRKIVERHNGRLWVESQPGEGSTFHFFLPTTR